MPRPATRTPPPFDEPSSFSPSQVPLGNFRARDRESPRDVLARSQSSRRLSSSSSSSNKGEQHSDKLEKDPARSGVEEHRNTSNKRVDPLLQTAVSEAKDRKEDTNPFRLSFLASIDSTASSPGPPHSGAALGPTPVEKLSFEPKMVLSGIASGTADNKTINRKPIMENNASEVMNASFDSQIPPPPPPGFNAASVENQKSRANSPSQNLPHALTERSAPQSAPGMNLSLSLSLALDDTEPPASAKVPNNNTTGLNASDCSDPQNKSGQTLSQVLGSPPPPPSTMDSSPPSTPDFVRNASDPQKPKEHDEMEKDAREAEKVVDKSPSSDSGTPAIKAGKREVTDSELAAELERESDFEKRAPVRNSPSQNSDDARHGPLAPGASAPTSPVLSESKCNIDVDGSGGSGGPSERKEVLVQTGMHSLQLSKSVHDDELGDVRDLSSRKDPNTHPVLSTPLNNAFKSPPPSSSLKSASIVSNSISPRRKNEVIPEAKSPQPPHAAAGKTPKPSPGAAAAAVPSPELSERRSGGSSSGGSSGLAGTDRPRMAFKMPPKPGDGGEAREVHTTKEVSPIKEQQPLLSPPTRSRVYLVRLWEYFCSFLSTFFNPRGDGCTRVAFVMGNNRRA